MNSEYQQPLLTLEEAASYLQVSIEQLRIELEQQRIPGLPIAGTWRISREVINRLLGIITTTNAVAYTQPSTSTTQNASLTSNEIVPPTSTSTAQNTSLASNGIVSPDHTVDTELPITESPKIDDGQATKAPDNVPSPIHQALPPGHMRAKVLRYNIIERFGYAKPLEGPAILFESRFQIKPNQTPLPGDIIEFELRQSKKGALQAHNIQIIPEGATEYVSKSTNLPVVESSGKDTSHAYPSPGPLNQSSLNPTTLPIKSPPRLKPTSEAMLPKGQGAYTLAKRAHAEKDYQVAEKYYRQAIQEDGDKKESAIKDLAALLQQQNQPEKAIELLEKYRPHMQDKRTVDNILATFFQHMGRHPDAIRVLNRLLVSAPEYNKPVMLKRIALSQFKSQDYITAEKTLRQVLSYRPMDTVAQRWLTALQDATASGEYTVANQIITAPDILADYASELSAFTLYHLEHCDFQGLEPSKISTKEFTESDVDRLENLAKKLGIRRPRERAAYYLSAAKILSLSQTEDDYTRMHDYLRRYFASMGDAALADKRHLDVARAFYCESFALSSGPRVWMLEEPNIVLARYLYSFFDQPDSLLNLKMLSVGDTVKGLFGQYTNGTRVFDAILYMSVFSRDAANRILSEIYRMPELRKHAIQFLEKRGILSDQIALQKDPDNFLSLWQQLRQEMAEKQARRYAEFTYLRQVRVATDSLENFIQQIDRLMQDSIFDIDRQRLLSLRQIALTVHEFCRRHDFEEQERLSSVAFAQCSVLKSEIISSSTKLSIENILPILEQLISVTEERFGEIMRTARPEVKVSLAVESYTPDQNSEIELQLLISNSVGSSPAVTPKIIFESRPDYFQVSSLQWPLKESLRGGATKTEKIPVRVTKEALQSQAFPINVEVSYLNRGGETQYTDKKGLTVRLYSAKEFEDIANPYAAYAEGGPVIEEDMFYGRNELVMNLTHAILSAESRNKSVVIYGQKRAGKSSILYHISTRLKSPVIAVYFSVQDIETELSYATFLYRILQRMSEVIEDEIYKGSPFIEFSLPSLSHFMEHPSILFHQTMSDFQKKSGRTEQWQKARVVLLIDEFTDIYKAILRGYIPETFMKNWKALIEKQYFGAVLVGQDVMPKFKGRFPNEFGVLQEERINYLDEKYAKRLIVDPIRIPVTHGEGESRYRAQAVERILELTAGNPFYIMIICNRLVDYMNKVKAKYVTDVDVDTVKNELLTGGNSLGIDKFDNLLTAGDSDLEEINPIDTLAVCRAIAVGSQMGWCNLKAIDCHTETPLVEILKDLVDRDVVEKRGAEDYRLRVGLFREWLLTHQ